MPMSDENLTPAGIAVRVARGDRRQREMAELLGCTPSFLCNVERGRKRPGVDKLARWRAVTGVPPEAFYPELAAAIVPQEDEQASRLP